MTETTDIVSQTMTSRYGCSLDADRRLLQDTVSLAHLLSVSATKTVNSIMLRMSTFLCDECEYEVSSINGITAYLKPCCVFIEKESACKFTADEKKATENYTFRKGESLNRKRRSGETHMYLERVIRFSSETRDAPKLSDMNKEGDTKYKDDASQKSRSVVESGYLSTCWKFIWESFKDIVHVFLFVILIAAFFAFLAYIPVYQSALENANEWLHEPQLHRGDEKCAIERDAIIMKYSRLLLAAKYMSETGKTKRMHVLQEIENANGVADHIQNDLALLRERRAVVAADLCKNEIFDHRCPKTHESDELARNFCESFPGQSKKEASECLSAFQRESQQAYDTCKQNLVAKCALNKEEHASLEAAIRANVVRQDEVNATINMHRQNLLLIEDFLGIDSGS